MTTDDTLILHHYDGSPFSEKVRLILGHKRLAWQSVKIPVVMPKPDLVALTGGYRRTPVMQRGADVYCDTALIARWLDSLAPEPALFPPGVPLAPLLAQWADGTLFWSVIPYAMQPAGRAHIFQGLAPEVLQAFAADRAPFTAGLRRQTVADAGAALAAYAEWLDAQLAHGGPWLLGTETPTIADFAVGHCGWYVRRGGPEVAAVLDRHPRLSAWLDRVLAIGHGSAQALTSAQALEVAASARGHAPVAVQPGLGFEHGAAVTVSAIDYGTDPVAGTLVGLSLDEVVVERDDARAGRVHVHFPRRGFQIKQEQAT